MWECIRIKNLDDIIIEVNIEETLGMIIMTEVGVGLEKVNFKVIWEEMIEAAVVDLGQDQEQVLLGIE